MHVTMPGPLAALDGAFATWKACGTREPGFSEIAVR
jgi:hypothetical protein